MRISPRNRPASRYILESRRRPRRRSSAHGKDVWQNAKCWECHGQTGKGDGEKAAGLKDDFGFPVRPADLTSGQFKSGPSVQDIFRTMSTGLSGTPMPSFRDSLPEQDRWALAYYVLSLSAFKDPLTGEPLQDLLRRTRAALDDPKLRGEHPGGRLRSGRGPESVALRHPTRHRPSPQARSFAAMLSRRRASEP